MSSDTCVVLRREMLPGPVDVHLDEEADFNTAYEIAYRTARGHSNDATMLSWFDSVTGRHSPPADCCGEDRPTWLVYAESRGADMSVSINNEKYVFVFWSGNIED